ncbi:hypothetical protein BK734_21350 [Bacillus thuringiensis serovar kim]|nr:hypothetical protein BK734_21350 [Bacillus thuringiensis serovar kim]PGV02335.1 hypothetical protein COD69_02610 [Bacillus thuringiensis]
MSEHALISLRYRGITDDIYFQNHKIGFTYMQNKSLPNCRRAFIFVFELQIRKVIDITFYPTLTGRKRPIGSTNNQWGMNKTPTC